jgi:hypothetical protein
MSTTGKALLPISVISLALLTSCGSTGSTSSTPSQLPPPLSISLTLSRTQIFMSAGSSQSLSVSVSGQNGFSGLVTVTATGVPSGMTVSPTPLVVNSGSAGMLNFVTAASAAAGQSQITLSAASGAIQTQVTVTLTVGAMPISRPFTRLGGNILFAYYDEQRQLLFATNVARNEVDVLSGADLTIRARVPVPLPIGIDQMPDKTTLIVGTSTQTLYTIDEDTFSVTPHPAPNFSALVGTTTQVLLPVAMANGKVLILSHDFFIEGFCGNHIIEWDPTSGTFSQPTLPPEVQNRSGGNNVIGYCNVANLSRSADRKWMFGGPNFFYNSDTDSFSAGPVDNSDVRAVAANSKGSQFAVASGQSITFYDQQLNIVGTFMNSLGGAIGETYIQYSADDSKLYWQTQNIPSVGTPVDVIDTTRFVDLGSTNAEYVDGPDILWVDSRQRAFLSPIINGSSYHSGVGLVDLTVLSSTPQTTVNFSIPNAAALSVGSSASVTFDNLRPDVAITFAGRPATILSVGAVVNGYGELQVMPPSISASGPVDLVLTNPNGATQIETQAFSYGLSLSAVTANLLPPTGNPVIGLLGFGLTTPICPCSTPNVSVGGKSVLGISNISQFNDVTAATSLNEFLIEVPNGMPGASSVAVSATTGAGSLPVAYIPFADIIPAAGLLSILYDSRRDLLYALKSNEIDVFNPATKVWQAPIPPAGGQSTIYQAMTLTPDGSRLLVVGSNSNTLTIVNPDNPSQSVAVALPNQPTAIAATNNGKAFIPLVGTGLNVGIAEFDIAGMTYTIRSDNLGNLSGKFAATLDGSHMAVVQIGGSVVNTWNSASDSFISQTFPGNFWSDAAISPDGSRFAAMLDNGAGATTFFIDEQLHWLGATVYPDLGLPDAEETQGACFTLSGKTLVVPTRDSIEFFDADSGHLKDRLMTPELLAPIAAFPPFSVNMALDQTGQMIFAISASGLTVMKLPAPADQLEPGVWP